MIPKDAKLVFKGVTFDTYQWEQKVYDGSFRTFESVKRANGAEVIATVGDKIIVLTEEQPNRPAPFLSLPGGATDKGEEPLDGAKRELLEETGYSADTWELWRTIQPSSRIEWHINTCIARDCKKTNNQDLGSGEKIKVDLMSFEDFLELSLEPSFRQHFLKIDMIHAKYDAEFREVFRKIIFG